MSKFKFILHRQSLETIYTCFIRPITEYADVLWDNCTKNEVCIDLRIHGNTDLHFASTYIIKPYRDFVR